MPDKQIVPRISDRLRQLQKALSEDLEKAGVEIRSPEALAVLAVDCSGSMGERDKMQQAKDGAREFAQQANTTGYNIGLIGFDSSARVIVALTSNLSILYSSLEKLTAGGSTNLTEAIHLSMGVLRSRTALRYIIIVTDGMPDNPITAFQAAKMAHNEGIQIIAIGTDDADHSFLRKLTTSDELAMPTHASKLGSALGQVAALLPAPREKIKKTYSNK